MNAYPYQIRNLARHELTLGADTERERVVAYWTAELVNGDTRVNVSRRSGSWVIVGEDGSMRELLPVHAERLQEKVRPIERAERKAAEAAGKAEAEEVLDAAA